MDSKHQNYIAEKDQALMGCNFIVGLPLFKEEDRLEKMKMRITSCLGRFLKLLCWKIHLESISKVWKLIFWEENKAGSWFYDSSEVVSFLAALSEVDSKVCLKETCCWTDPELMEANFQLPSVLETFILHLEMGVYKTSHRSETKPKQNKQKKTPSQTPK